MKQNIIISAVIALLVALGVSQFSQPETVRVSDSNGEAPAGALTGPDVNSYLTVAGFFSQGGGVTTVTPTSASVTLTSGDMLEENIITFTASSTQPALTVTLPASTTIPLSTKPGAYRSWVIENPFTAAATTTTIAAGTGIDLQEPDGQNVVIGINNYAFLTCFRESSSDVVCRVDETIPAD